MKYLYALTMALVFRNWISLLSKPEKAIGNEGVVITTTFTQNNAWLGLWDEY